MILVANLGINGFSMLFCDSARSLCDPLCGGVISVRRCDLCAIVGIHI